LAVQGVDTLSFGTDDQTSLTIESRDVAAYDMPDTSTVLSHQTSEMVVTIDTLAFVGGTSGG